MSDARREGGEAGNSRPRAYRRAMRALATVMMAAFLAACGPIDQSGADADAGAGAVGGADAGAAGAGDAGALAPVVAARIVSPADGDKCDADDAGRCPIALEISGASLAPPGQCGSASPCGHVDLFLDGTACGAPNSQFAATKGFADFSRCAKFKGRHEVSCEIRDDAGRLLARTQTIELEAKRKGGDDDDQDD
jgi:hypothetical protein